MSTDPPEQEAPVPSAGPPFDPVRERERILAQMRGKVLDAHQAELICTALAVLAEMEAER